MPKKTILLVTQGFPFGESERGFLPTEFARLTEKFRVVVLAVGAQDRLIYPLAEDVRAVPYTYKSPREVGSRGSMLCGQLRWDVLRDMAKAVKKCHGSTVGQRIKQSLSYSLNAWQIGQTMERLIKEENISLVYTYWCTQATLAALRLKEKFPKLKVITRFLGFDLYNERTATGRQPYRDVIAAKTDVLLFLGEPDRKYFVDRWPIAENCKSVLSELGCQPMKFKAACPEDKLRIVSCSNLLPLKRVHLIIEGLKQLSDTIPVEWHHIGDGPLRAELEQKAQECFSEKKNISWKFCGAVSHDLVDTLYCEFAPHLFITTTATEGGIPVSVQEAFSAGLPVIATAVGGIPECLQSGEAGILLREDTDAAEVAEAIEAYWNKSTEQKRAMSTVAFTMWQQKYDAEKNACQIASLLDLQ